MSGMTSFPYSFDSNVLTDNDAGDVQQLEGATRPLKLTYDKRLTVALTWLANYCPKIQAGGSEVATILKLIQLNQLDPAVNPAMAPVPPRAAKLAQEVMTRAATLDQHPIGLGWLRAAATIWESQAPEIWARLTNINKLAQIGAQIPAAPQPFNLDAWRVITDFIRQLYTKIITSFQINTDVITNKFKTIVAYNQDGITARLFARLLFASKTAHVQGTSVDKFLAIWVMTQIVGPINDSLQEIETVLRGPTVEYDKAPVSGFIDEIHRGNSGSALNLNTQLIRWFSDAGLGSFAVRVPPITHEMVDGLSNIDKAHHYANDAMRNYLLIIHDTLFFRFLGAKNKLPRVVKDMWSQEQSRDNHPLESIDGFISELFFTNISRLVGSDMRDPKQLAAFASNPTLREFEECPLSLALGRSYPDMLRKAALDSDNAHVQIRTEALFEFLVTDAFRNLSTISPESREHSEPYAAIIEILDTLERKILDMTQSITTVFTILNNPKVKASLLTTDQVHAGEVISFVKIRNDNLDYGNRRFELHLDAEARAMLLKYEEQPRRLYGAFMARKAGRRMGGGDACAEANAAAELFRRYKALGKPKVVLNNVVAEYLDARKRCKTKYMIKPASTDLRAWIDGDAPPKAAKAATVAMTNTAAAAKTNAARPAQLVATMSNPTGLNKSGNVALTAGVTVEPIADDTLLAPEGSATAETAIPRGRMRTYVFGPFTRVYKPDEQPYNIAAPSSGDSRTVQATVVNRLVAGQNVCIFGYGQSGSGKTSLLIFRQKSATEGEMGVMSHICNWLAQPDSPYKAIKCDIREIGVLNSEVRVLDGTHNPFYASKYFVPDMVSETVMDGRKTVTKQMRSWIMYPKDHAGLPALRKLAADVPPSGYSESGVSAARMQRRKAQGIPDGDPDANYVSEDYLRSLGGYVYFSTENSRLTKATTNNPTSSRSHVFVFLRFIPKREGAPSPTLVIGDFAGVENRFACTNSAVLRSFATIKKFPDQANSIDAYEPELRSAFDRDVRPLLVGTKFAAVPYRDIESFGAAASKSTANWGQLTSFALERSSAEMASGVPFVKTTIAKFISDIGKIKRTDKMMKVAFNHLNGDQIEPFTHLANASPIRRLTMNWLIRGKWSDEAISIDGRDAAVDARQATRMLRIFERVGNMTEAEVFLYELIRASTELFMSAECSMRVQEGAYINKSLETFRNFLSSSLQRKGASPKVMGECAAIQCNPFFNDCFGSTFATPSAIGEVERTLVQMLKPQAWQAIANETTEVQYSGVQAALDDLTFCIFNVINISKDRNDPPATPFIDCNHLVFEYNRAMSIPARMEYLGKEKTGQPVSALGAPFDQSVLNDLEQRVNQYASDAAQYAQENPAEMSLAQAATAAAEARADAVKAITAARAVASSSEFLPAVKNVILTLERINASTLVGTMMFTDTLAKFGLNRTMCTLPTEGGDSVEYLNKILFGHIGNLQASMRKIMCDGLLRGGHCGETQ